MVLVGIVNGGDGETDGERKLFSFFPSPFSFLLVPGLLCVMRKWVNGT